MAEDVKSMKSSEIEKVETKISKRRVFPLICSYINEDTTRYNIEINLPGVEKDSIDLKLGKSSVFVKGETDSITYIGSYRLGCAIKFEKAKSTYKEGLLKISVPFKETELKTIDIDIL